MNEVHIKHILAAIDFSDWTSPVLQASAMVACKYDAALTVIYAESFTPPPYFTEHDVDRLMKSLEDQRAFAQQYLNDTVQNEIGHQIQAETRLVEMSPADAIEKTASAIDADMIIMGTHGRSGMSTLLLGPETERIIRESHIPVLTVRGVGEDQAGTGYNLPFQKILCPVNYTETATCALSYAADLAHRSDAELTVMYSLDDGIEEKSLHHQQGLLGSWITETLAPDCKVHPVIRRGEAAQEVLKMVEDHEMDLVVIGLQHRPFHQATIVGTTSIRIIRHAMCPVLTVVT